MGYIIKSLTPMIANTTCAICTFPFVLLGSNLSGVFGLKLNTKLSLENYNHPSKTFRRVLGIAGDQDLVC